MNQPEEQPLHELTQKEIWIERAAVALAFCMLMAFFLKVLFF